MKNFTLIVFCLIFETLAIIASSRPLMMEPLLWVALAFAASMGGRAVAYYQIFSWLRGPFTKVVPHSCGAGESVEPCTDKGPLIETVGDWMSCPLCAGTWIGMGLVFLYAFEPHLGAVMIYVIGAAGLGSLVTRYVEMIEWQGRYAWELTGWQNRQNKTEQYGIPNPITLNSNAVIGETYSVKIGQD